MAEVDALTSSLQKVLRHSIHTNDLARGLSEALRALEFDHDKDESKAALCLLATDCSDDNYKKLISAVCKTWKVCLFDTIPQYQTL